MNEIELVQLPNGIEDLLSTLKPATKASWNLISGKYEIDNSEDTVEKFKAGCELVKDSLRDIYSFGETIARGTPKFCLALRRVFNNLQYVEDENGKQYSLALKELNVKPSMNDNGQSGHNFTKLVGELGLSSTAAYRYKDLGRFVDEQTGEWLTDFKGYSISLLSEIWTYASKYYLTYKIEKLAKVIPANTTIDDMRQFVKVMKLWYHCKAPFKDYEIRKKIGFDTPLQKVLKIYNNLIRKQEAGQKQEPVGVQQPATHYSGQLSGQIAMTLEIPPAEPEEVIPEVGNDTEAESTVSEEPETLPTKEELVSYCLKNLDSEKKLEIYGRFFIDSELANFAAFLQTIYLFKGYRNGSKYRSGGDRNNIFFEYQNEQLTKTLIDTQLTYSEAAKKIFELITFNDYLTDEEKNLYMQRESERENKLIEDPFEEPAEPEEVIPEVGKVIDIEDEPRQLTNREYLSTLSDEQFVFELCRKIIGIFPMSGKSATFMSTVRSKLKEWLKEIHEVQ